MRRKFFFMSLMLMGLVSLFSSCVDGDYYDLYEDEELLSPRNKRGKDVHGSMIDLSMYPWMSSDGEYAGWYKAECVACCYSNIFGADKVTSRMMTILAAYGSFEDNYSTYFTSVQYSGVPTCAVETLFGSSKLYPSEIAAWCVSHNVGSDWRDVQNENWVSFADATGGDAGGTHVAAVHSLNLVRDGDGYLIRIRVVDQNNDGIVHNKYQIRLNRHKQFSNTGALHYFIDAR